jgi:hypothetical protein
MWWIWLSNFFCFCFNGLIIIVASRLPHVAIHINAIVRLFLITTNLDVISKITKKHHVCRKKKKKTQRSMKYVENMLQNKLKIQEKNLKTFD